MKELIEAIQKKSGWKELLKEFCDRNSSSWTFVDRYCGVALKTSLLKELWKLLNLSIKTLSNEDTLLLMLSIRILLREPAGIEPLLTQEVLEFFLNQCFLTSTSTTFLETPISLESLRVIVNLTTRSEDNRDRCISTYKIHNPIASFLERSFSDDSKLFLLYRLLVQLTMNPSNALAFHGLPILSFISRDLKRSLSSLTSLDQESIPLFVSDAFISAFSLTSHLGPFGKGGAVVPQAERPNPTNQEREFFGNMLPICDNILSLSYEPAMKFGWLRQSVLSLLVNSPKGWTELVPNEMLIKSMKSFIVCVQQAIIPELSPEKLIPPLMLLMGIIEAKSEMTNPILDEIFPIEYRNQASQSPVSVEGPEILNTSDCIGAKLTKIMTTTNIVLKYIVQEFLFEICSHNPDKLCQLTGIGYAAGLLQAHSLFGANIQ